MTRRIPILLWIALLMLSLTVGGCSYFNAFYNTKRAYKEAEAARERSTDLRSQPAEYNEAVEAGARLIEMYPDSKYIDDALFIMGQSYYWLKDYHKARRKFEELLRNYPDSPYYQEGQMWLGKVNVQLKKRDTATTLLRGLIAETDDPRLVGESRFALAELYFVDSSYVKAAEEFAKIPDVSKDSELIGEAYWRAGQSLYFVQEYAQAEVYLRQALDYDLTPALRFRTRLQHGQSLLYSDREEQALNIFNSLLKDKRYFDDHGVVRVQKGIALARLGQIEQAFEEWERTIEDYPRSDEAAQAYYQMGLVHLEKAGERPAAKEAFNKARTEKARSRYSMKADTLLNQLERVDQLTLDRAVLRSRIEFTEAWVTNPVSPKDTSAFVQTSYYDSLAIDSLKLAPMWLTAWRDSVITPEPDSTALADSMETAAVEAAGEKGAIASDGEAPVETDGDAAPPRPSLDPFAEYANRKTHTVSRPDTLEATKQDTLPADSHESISLSQAEEIVSRPDSATVGVDSGTTQSDSLSLVGTQPDSVAGTEADVTPAPVADPGRRMSPQDVMQRGGDPEELRAAWEQMLAENHMGGGADSLRTLPGESPEFEGAEMLADQDADSSMAADSSEAPAEPKIETITLFDTSPVLDSLAQMRANLQDARFQLGEIQLFNLQQPDSARVIFRELADPPNVDSVRARALTVLAFIEKEQGDNTAADSILRNIARDFPTTRSGREVIEKLGIEMNEPVSAAELAYQEAESLYVDAGKPQEAYSRYRWIASTYQASDWAPRALYAAAYIAGEKLGDGETTEELFNTLIEDYSDTPQAQRARKKISAFDAIRFATNTQDTVDVSQEFADIDALTEDEVDETASIVGGVETLASTLDARNLLPQDVIQGTGGEVLIRFVVFPDNRADNFRVVMEDPPGSGIGRALVAGLEQVEFRAARVGGEPVATKVERRYTLPLDAPPNVRPLPKR